MAPLRQDVSGSTGRGILTTSLPIIKGPSTRVVGGTSDNVVHGPKGLVRVGEGARPKWYNEAIVKGTHSIIQVPELEGGAEWRLTVAAREELFRPKPKDDAKVPSPTPSPPPSTVPPFRAPPAVNFKTGATVIVKGMPGLEGAEGTVVSWVADMERWDVRLPPPKGMVKLKPENLVLKEVSPAVENAKEGHQDRLVRRTTEKNLASSSPPDPPDGTVVAPEFVPGGFGEKPSKAFEWLRYNNQEYARALRREIAEQTRQSALAGGYMKAGRLVRLNRVKEMLEGTKRIAPSLGTYEAPKSSGVYSETKVRGMSNLTLGACLELRDEHRNGVGAVSAASSYHCGGGFETGGRHALEEAICIQSTVFLSLSKMEHEVLQDMQRSHGRFTEHLTYIPSDGVILSPLVEVFRDGSDHGYPFLTEPVQLAALISLGMYNKNERMSDCPVDAPPSSKEYKEGVKQKFRSMFSAAIKARCVALVIPDVGCGVYQNDAKEVGTCLGEVLREEFWCHLREVVVVGKKEFQDAVKKTCETIGKRLEKIERETAPPRQSDRQSLSPPPRQSDDFSSGGGGVGLFVPSAFVPPGPPPRTSLVVPKSSPSHPPTSSRSPSPPVHISDRMSTDTPSPRDSVTMCKFNCGRPAKEGFNTCCRTCGRHKGDGSHDSECAFGEVVLQGERGRQSGGGGRRHSGGRNSNEGAHHSRSSGRSSFSPPESASGSPRPMERPMCKFGCGRRAAPGTTRSGKPLDTCCKTCAMSKGQGGHGPECEA